MPGETGADYEQVATAEEMEEEVVPDLPTIDNDDQLDEVSGDLTSELAWLTSIPDNGTKTVRLPADTCSLYAALVVLALVVLALAVLALVVLALVVLALTLPSFIVLSLTVMSLTVLSLAMLTLVVLTLVVLTLGMLPVAATDNVLAGLHSLFVQIIFIE